MILGAPGLWRRHRSPFSFARSRAPADPPNEQPHMPRPTPVPDWVPRDLPRAPGVYRFLGERDAPLYIGKSVNLRRRVRGHFYGGGQAGRLTELGLLARAVSYRQTGSDLEARLLEARAILKHRPRLNRALKNRWRGWYLEIDEGEPFPRPLLVHSPRRASARYFGPFAGRRLPLEIARLLEDLFGLRSCTGAIRPDPRGPACLRHGIGTCSAPCIGVSGLNEYRNRVRDAIEVLADAGAARRLRARLVEQSAGNGAAGQSIPPSAGRRLVWLDELESYRSVLARPGQQASLLVILPDHKPERRVLLPVALGKVLRSRSVAVQDGVWQEAVADACYAIRVRELGMDGILQPDEMVLSLILRRWLDTDVDDIPVYDLARLDDRQVVRSATERTL